MRQPKYRSWLNGRKMVVTNIDLVNGEVSGIGWDIEEGEDCVTWKYDCLEESTGLLDKNGKEIYEGDIVTWGYGNTTVRFGGMELEDDQGSAFTVTGWIVSDCTLDSRCEVIGNIHENPELLNAR
jgi:uncharacterized phage protein (TIGR01671 family)